MDVCSEFRRAQTSKWRTLLYFREFKYVASKDDVTFVAQTSYERLHMVEELSKFWDGKTEKKTCVEITFVSKHFIFTSEFFSHFDTSCCVVHLKIIEK